MKYIKKPIIIDAVILEESQHSIKKCLEFMGQLVNLNCNAASDGFESYCRTLKERGGLVIKTLEGEHIASFGDYIIKGVKDEFYPCKPDVFKITYSELIDTTSQHKL